jgi:hypothetical protein
MSTEQHDAARMSHHQRDANDVQAAVQRCTWAALTDPGKFPSSQRRRRRS